MAGYVRVLANGVAFSVAFQDKTTFVALYFLRLVSDSRFGWIFMVWVGF